MKTIWIVDASYLIKSIPIRYDFLKLKHCILDEIGCDDFSDSFYVDSDMNDPMFYQKSFYNWIKKAEPHGPQMRVILKEVKQFNSTCDQCGNLVERKIQKGVDVKIATLMLTLAFQDKYDRIVLSSGDGDFDSAIKFVKDNLDKTIILNGFHSTLSSDLQQYADEIVWLDDLVEKIKRED